MGNIYVRYGLDGSRCVHELHETENMKGWIGDRIVVNSALYILVHKERCPIDTHPFVHWVKAADAIHEVELHRSGLIIFHPGPHR